MSLSTTVLKPLNDTLTEYRPALSAGTLKVPVPSVTAVKVPLVALLVTTTVAPGMTAPPESTTVPESVAVTWAETSAGAQTTTTTIHQTRANLMRDPPPRGLAR